MQKIKFSGVSQYFLLGIIVLLTIRCKKEDNNPINPYNGKTTAVFNPSLTYGTLTDQDGNVYKTIKIGTQTWMAENLRTTKYNDSTEIPNVTSDEEWFTLFSTGAYCNYNNTLNADTISTFGRLYNWSALKTGKLAPIGWHIPTDTDWLTLTDYLGGDRTIGCKLKEADTTHWVSPNTCADNSSGFTAVPAGARYFWDDSFDGIGKDCSWWSSSGGGNIDVWIRFLNYNNGHMDLDASNLQNGVRGISVRCIKDDEL
jgi:uncharacterized protein (TIGR02145 family)